MADTVTLTGAEYEEIHRAAIDAYEAATPADYRYVVRKHVELAALNHDRPQGANRND